MIDGNGAVLDGSAIPDDDWTFYRDNIFCFRPPELSHAVLFFHGRSLSPLPLSQSTAYPPRLALRPMVRVEGAIYFAVDQGKLPHDYQFSYAAMQTGITFYQVQGVVIRNLTIQGFQADGVSAAVGSREVLLENVTCMANGQSGVCVRGGAQVAIDACKLFGNGECQLLTLPHGETHIFASELTNDTARGWLDQGGRTYLGSNRIEGGKKAIKPEQKKVAGTLRVPSALRFRPDGGRHADPQGGYPSACYLGQKGEKV